MHKDIASLLYLLLISYSLFIMSCESKAPTTKSKPHPSELYKSSTDVISADTLNIQNAPKRITRNIRQTKKGNLLMASFEDVIIYDGSTYTPIPKPQGVESFDAFDSLEDSEGNIWIASTHYGVYKYDGHDFEHFTTEHGLGHIRTMRLLEDSNKDIWVGSMGGLSLYHEGRFINYPILKDSSSNDVSIIYEDQSGDLWLGTRGSTFVFDIDSKQFSEIKDSEGNIFYNVWAIVKDHSGNIWLGGQNGLWRYDGSSYINVSRDFISAIYLDNTGNLWVVTPRNGLFKYDKSHLESSEILPELVFINVGMVFGVSGDTEGNIWLGTGNGVLKYNGSNVIRHTRLDSDTK